MGHAASILQFAAFRQDSSRSFQSICLLHCPTEVKPPEVFSAALKNPLETRGPNFRYFHFLQRPTVELRNREFSSVVDLSRVGFVNLDLTDARLKKGLVLEADAAADVFLSNATIEKGYRTPFRG